MVKDCAGEPEVVIVAAGSEVQEALTVWGQLREVKIRVLSMPCRELFLRQERAFRDSLLPPQAGRVVVEAGVAQGWEALSAQVCPVLSIERFGLSAPGPDAARALGINADSLREMVLAARRSPAS